LVHSVLNLEQELFLCVGTVGDANTKVVIVGDALFNEDVDHGLYIRIVRSSIHIGESKHQINIVFVQGKSDIHLGEECMLQAHRRHVGVLLWQIDGKGVHLGVLYYVSV